jgi:hypothetical protein
VTANAVTTRPSTDQCRISWTNHRSNSRKAKLDAITPTRVKICLSVANLVRRLSHLAGPSSLGQGLFILPITPVPLDIFPNQREARITVKDLGVAVQQRTNKRTQRKKH